MAAEQARDELATLIATPPEGERSLLELVASPRGLGDAPQRVAGRVRLFLLTWDPLDWLPGRGVAWVTANGDGDAYELCAYVAHTALGVEREAEGAEDQAATAIDLLGRLARSILIEAGAIEELLIAGAYPQLAFEGRGPSLVGPHAEAVLHGEAEGVPGAGQGGTIVLAAAAGAWEPIGLGAIQDLVQEAFGPVDLDRSKVALEAPASATAGCPACAGERFGFPGELEEARPGFCSPHRAQALAVTGARFERARRSNPSGWRAIAWASSRLDDMPDPDEVPPVPQRRSASPGRNEPCPCGSGRKYKHCHGR